MSATATVTETTRTIRISASEVRETDVATAALPYASWHENAKYLASPSGEHYKLLAAIAAKFVRGRFYDVGTYLGHSALALATRSGELGNQVVSFDIQDCFDARNGAPPGASAIKSHGGIELRHKDAIEDVAEIAANADFVLLDVTPHDGKFERVFITELIRLDYKGLMLLDDIHLNPEMTALWQWVPAERKIDLTDLGHWSGTGLVAFDPENTIDFEVGSSLASFPDEK
jgi:predicted O-methyltransferase YrrM